MNCHGNNNENSNNHQHNGFKHMLHMILCCGLPVLIILVLPFIAKISPAFAGVLGAVAPFLCPILMAVMMIPMMLGGKQNKDKNCHANAEKMDNN
ncbi:MAG TPA: hypothetical protein VN131_07570 [Mobilitalea sp.]|nr:hypothetical protein [Mobilitalea sp.]